MGAIVKTTESCEFAVAKPGGRWLGVPRRGALRREHEVVRERASVDQVRHDFYVFKDDQRIIGVVSEVTVEPRFGRNAPTLYLRRISDYSPVAATKERTS